MISKHTLASWLHKLGNRIPGTTDIDHIVRLSATTSDDRFALYLDGIRKRIAERGFSYGAAIAEALVLDLDDASREKLAVAPTSAEASLILNEFAFQTLKEITDHDHLYRIFAKSGYRFSEHRYADSVGPYDIDLYTAMTDSYPNPELTGETVNVSFSFTVDGALRGIRSYSMGHAPANPLERGGPQPKYEGIRKRRGPRRSNPIWWMRLTAPARDRYMRVTPRLVEFVQGWGLQTPQLEIDFEERLEIRGRTRPFQRVKFIELSDGKTSLPAASLDTNDRSSFERLLADRQLLWCLHPMVSDLREDLFEYDCFISIGFPNSPDDVERAESAYLRELAITSTSN